MNFMLVFAGNDKPCFYTYGAVNAEQAASFGEDMSKREPARWGEFLYARSPARQSIKFNTLYVFRYHLQANQMRYRQDFEVLFGPFDYLQYEGPHRENLRFNLEGTDGTSGFKFEMTAWFNAGRSFKFIDMCKDYLVQFVLRDGVPIMEFHETQFSGPRYSITLERHCQGQEVAA